MSASQGPHSLAFRVMRLCRPSFRIDHPLRLDALDHILGEDFFEDNACDFRSDLCYSFSGDGKRKPAMEDVGYWRRFELADLSDLIGFPGVLVLPQAFGAIYLGETFCSYISINNSSKYEIRDIIIKAEIQTERQRVLLLDTARSPVESIRSGGRYDFIVEHDVKELGPHTLVCTALYNDGDGERKYLPQFFKFVVANPLSVRTKVRSVKETTYLEACIENHTKSSLYMDQVDFEPSVQWTATTVGCDYDKPNAGPLSRQIINPPAFVRPGGTNNYLYQLKMSVHEPAQVKEEVNSVLGKLQITWRTNLGEPGRLQTQQILGNPITQKEVELQILELPLVIVSGTPFLVHLCLMNHTDRRMGPFEVFLSQENSAEEKVIMANGLWTLALSQLEAFGSTHFSLNLVATKVGALKMSGIAVVCSREKKIYDTLAAIEIFVGFK
ncbi:uncharacterized protein LOC116265978 [Nymphaea colorata]|nr:uncharacterized protein LOC116265978 [Nymphaea colorata]